LRVPLAGGDAFPVALYSLLCGIFPYSTLALLSERCHIVTFGKLCIDFGCTTPEMVVSMCESQFSTLRIPASLITRVYAFHEPTSHHLVVNNFNLLQWRELTYTRYALEHVYPDGASQNVVDTFFTFPCGRVAIDISLISKSWVCLMCDPAHLSVKPSVATPVSVCSPCDVLTHALSKMHLDNMRNRMYYTGYSVSECCVFSYSTVAFLQQWSCKQSLQNLASVLLYGFSTINTHRVKNRLGVWMALLAILENQRLPIASVTIHR
jgi:hypothetical protein